MNDIHCPQLWRSEYPNFDSATCLRRTTVGMCKGKGCPVGNEVRRAHGLEVESNAGPLCPCGKVALSPYLLTIRRLQTPLCAECYAAFKAQQARSYRLKYKEKHRHA